MRNKYSSILLLNDTSHKVKNVPVLNYIPGHENMGNGNTLPHLILSTTWSC